MHNPSMIVSYGTHLARVDRTASVSWDTYAAELLAAPPVSDDKASRGWSVPANFENGWRDAENLIARYALTFDYDTITRADVPVIEKGLAEYDYVIYTTASHTDEKPRLRVVIPCSRAMTPDEFGAVSRKVCNAVGMELASRESHVPAQMMFLPTVKPGAKFKGKRHLGKPVDVDAVLATYADWTDRTTWPRRKEHDSTRRAELGADPRLKPGVVGEFCKTYSIPDAIRVFELPYQHVHGNRWTYLHGSRPEGAVVYDEDTKLHSHHDTDPARGQHNAFDLVRLHKFGAEDKGLPEGTEVTQLRSWHRMLALIGQDERMAETRVGQDLQDFPELPPLTPAEQAAGQAAREANPAARRAEQAAEAAKVREEQAAGTVARRLSEVLAHPTVTRWLLPGLLEEQVIAVLAGPRGSYKSFIALDWAMKAALAGHPAYCISAEGGDFDRRARAWLNTYGDGVSPSTVPLYVVERRLDLNDKAGLDAVIQDCNRLGVKPKLFVLDTFSKLSGGLDENDNTEVKQFIGRLDMAFKRQGASVLLVAHTGHSEKGRPRGASAFGADTDAEYIASRAESISRVSVSRERFKSSPELPPLYFRPEVINLGYQDNDGAPVTSLVMVPAEHSDPKIISAPKPRGSTQIIAFQVCEQVLGAGPQPSGDVLDEVVKKMVKDPDAKRDTRKQIARKALEGLVAAGLLFMPDEHTLSLYRVVEEL